MKYPTHIYLLEETDTFGGERNFSWVRRSVAFVYPDDGADALAMVVARAGYEGAERSQWGEDLEFRFPDVCTSLVVQEIADERELDQYARLEEMPGFEKQ